MKKQKKKSAYWVVDVPGGWGIACCVEGESGYHPVGDYGPYAGPEGEKRAQGIVDRLNERLGHWAFGQRGPQADGSTDRRLDDADVSGDVGRSPCPRSTGQTMKDEPEGEGLRWPSESRSGRPSLGDRPRG